MSSSKFDYLAQGTAVSLTLATILGISGTAPLAKIRWDSFQPSPYMVFADSTTSSTEIEAIGYSERDLDRPTVEAFSKISKIRSSHRYVGNKKVYPFEDYNHISRG